MLSIEIRPIAGTPDVEELYREIKTSPEYTKSGNYLRPLGYLEQYDHVALLENEPICLLGRSESDDRYFVNEIYANGIDRLLQDEFDGIVSFYIDELLRKEGYWKVRYSSVGHESDPRMKNVIKKEGHEYIGDFTGEACIDGQSLDIEWYEVYKQEFRIADIIDGTKRGGEYSTRDVGTITDAYVHHSGVANGNAFKYAIHHVDTNGWPGIGYHFVIQPDGAIHQTNPLTAISYHTGGQNTNGVGICLTGDYEYATPPHIQVNAALWLMEQLKKQAPNLEWVSPHNKYKNTVCPGLAWDALLQKGMDLKLRP